MASPPGLDPDLLAFVRALARVHAERDFKAQLAKSRGEGRKDAA